MDQAIEVVGSLFVLAGFVLSQTGRLSQRSLVYLLANLVGSGALAAQACLIRQWGFLLLEGSWALVSAYGLWRRALSAGLPADEQH